MDRSIQRDLPPSVADAPYGIRLAALGKPVQWHFCFDLDVPPRALWHALIDTSRLNRAMGLPPMQYTETPGAACGDWRFLGVRYKWIEPPWAWVAGRTGTCLRVYDKGPARAMHVTFTVAPRETGSKVTIHFFWYPTNWFWSVILQIARIDFSRRYKHALQSLAEQLAAHRSHHEILPAAHRALPAAAKRRLASMRDKLVGDGVAQEIVELLTAHVENEDDFGLARLRVRPLSRRWNVDESELLLACLHATRTGLLSLSWDLLCPHCRGVRHAAKHLGDVPRRGACTVCEAEFGSDSPEAIEVTFRVNPGIRDVPQSHYCLAEPSLKAHILVQQPVEAGQVRTEMTGLVPGRYRMRLLGSDGARVLDVVKSADDKAIRWTAGDRGPLVAAPSPVIRFHNPESMLQTFIIEDAAWTDDAIRPAQLFNLQAFRDLFAAEYLAADVQLSVGEQVILFSDIVSSTEFYEIHGDAKAFAEVKRHFNEIYEEVQCHHGAVVKTIGDAAMAAFHNPVDALKAAKGLLVRFPSNLGDGTLRLRVAINAGSCIAVNLNSDIDYFGQAVNIAAKLQSHAGAGQIAFPKALCDDPHVAQFLADEQARLQDATLALPSIKKPIDVCVWDTNGPSDRSR